MGCDLRVGLGLACVPFSNVNGQYIKFLVSSSGEIGMPSCRMSPGEDGMTAASNLLWSLLGVRARVKDKGWVPLKLSSVLPVSSDPWSVVLVYGGMIPEELPVKDEGYKWMTWASLEKQGVVDPGQLQAMLYAAQRI